MIGRQKNRLKLVTFRLSLKEYDEVKEALNSEGGRSLSEFARLAIMQRVQQRHRTKLSLGEDLLTLSTKLEELDTALTDLSNLIRHVLGHGKNTE